MKIMSFESERGNVGDDFNLWVWPRLLPGVFDTDYSKIFIGIGSVLDHRFDEFGVKHVFGAGARSVETVPQLDDSWNVHCVRGPLTARALGLPQDVAITDPGILAAGFFERQLGATDVGLIPYFRSSHDEWKKVARSLNWRFISPREDVETFFAQLSGCKKVFTESLHGAIFADALRIPWVPYRSFSRVHEGSVSAFKWGDWLASMDLDVRLKNGPVIWDCPTNTPYSKIKSFAKRVLVVNRFMKELHNAQRPQLSCPTVSRKRRLRLLQELERFSAHGGSGPRSAPC